MNKLNILASYIALVGLIEALSTIFVIVKKCSLNSLLFLFLRRATYKMILFTENLKKRKNIKRKMRALFHRKEE